MKRSTVPTGVLTGSGHRHRHRRRPAHRREPAGEGALTRAVGLVAVLLLAASTGSMDTSPPAPSSRVGLAPSDQAEVVVDPSANRGQAIGADGDSPPTAEPPPNVGRVKRTAPAGDGRGVELAPAGSTNGVPISVLTAYRHAAAVLSRSTADCHLPVTLLAAIGKVESGHARGGRVDNRGNTVQAILGPVLDGGPGMAAIRDTDGGRLDGNTRWDRAVGPMQFIPGTWSRWATDGNADGLANPHNVYDASMASGRYLCADDRDLATDAGLDAAVLSYNRSRSYLRLVRAWMVAYASGTNAVPDGVGSSGPTNGSGGVVAQPPVSEPGAPGAPGQPGGPGGPDPGEPGSGDPGSGAPGGPGQPGGPGPGDPSGTPAPPTGPGQPPSGTPPPPPGPTIPPVVPPVVVPPLPDPLTGIGCVVQGIIGVGTGLVGGLIGRPPPAQPPCQPPPPTAPPTAPPP